MKPKEFDELIRQKFDQDDFAYNPRNWDRLAEQLDGRAKKRSIIMWWIMPLAGVAASVALAMGVAPVLNQGLPGKAGINTEVAKTLKVDGGKHAQSSAPQVTFSTTNKTTNTLVASATKVHPAHKNGNVAEDNTDEEVHIDLLNAVPDNKVAMKQKANINLLNQQEVKTVRKKDKKKEEVADAMNTFKPEAEQKVPKTSIILNGGYSQGSQNTGYTAGATIRRMVSERAYIESDVAFANSSITQAMPYRDISSRDQWYSNGVPIPDPISAKTTGTTSTTDGSPTPVITHSLVPVYGDVKTNNKTYDLSYLQVSPSLGYKIMKKMSLGIGPDFQQVVAGTQPAPSSTYNGNNQTAPLLDIGLVGKSEYMLTKKVRAGVYYRKGINNVLIPSDKYIDRDYLQFQLKCAIFNK